MTPVEKKKGKTGGAAEIAPGVYFLEVGKGMMRSNVYFIRSGASWVLIDTASVNCENQIMKAAEAVFGTDQPPSCILITHAHPDHEGAALKLARAWKCKVYFHPDDLPLAVNGTLEGMKNYASPLDRWMIFPMLRLIPRKKREAMLAKSSLKDVAEALDPSRSVPGLPDWKCIPTPGHMPGHAAFYHPGDGVLITGDAVVTADLNSPMGMLAWCFGAGKQKISGPPRYSTVNWGAAKQSAAILAGLKPRVLAPGHGLPMAGKDVALHLQAFADRFSGTDRKKA
jgi:glyoxylase-like metal-dependent hydrolase (beta-lactamase superfamily II)